MTSLDQIIHALPLEHARSLRALSLLSALGPGWVTDLDDQPPHLVALVHPPTGRRHTVGVDPGAPCVECLWRKGAFWQIAGLDGHGAVEVYGWAAVLVGLRVAGAVVVAEAATEARSPA